MERSVLVATNTLVRVYKYTAGTDIVYLQKSSVSEDLLINIIYQNVRDLNMKLSYFYTNSYEFFYHIIVFSKTWQNAY